MAHMWTHAYPPHTLAPAHSGEQLPVAARLVVSRGLGARVAAFRVSRVPGGFTTANARQRFSASFDRHATTVKLRGGGQVGLTLQGVGFGRTLAPFAHGAPIARFNRVDYRGGEVNEWYANGPAGLEQGFTLKHAPPGARRGPLKLSLAVKGTLKPHLDTTGGLIFGTSPGAGALRYGDLRVTDARGQELRGWLTLEHGNVLIQIDQRGARYPLRIDPLIELYASEGATESNLGYSVAAAPGVIVAGAPTFPGSGAFPTPVGAAYVFTEPAGGWASAGPTATQSAELIPSVREANEEFGHSVAISGETVVVGAPGHNKRAGAADVFTEPAGGWGSVSKQEQSSQLDPGEAEPESEFGTSVAISGSTVAVGAPLYTNPEAESRSGGVFVFEEPSGGWAANPTLHQSTTLAPSHEQAHAAQRFGQSVAIDEDGAEQAVLAGAPDDSIDEHQQQGSAFLFARPSTSTEWPAGTRNQQALLTASDGAPGDHFGTAVAASGEALVVGASGATVATNTSQGAAYVFTEPEAGWEASAALTQAAKLTSASAKAKEEFGGAVAIEGGAVLVSSQKSRQGEVFAEPAGGWRGELTANEKIEIKEAGASVFSLGLSGSTVAAGVPAARPPKGQGTAGEGAVDVFEPAFGPFQPTVFTGAADALQPTSAEVQASVNPKGSAVSTCTFQYGPSAALGSEAGCTLGQGLLGRLPARAQLSGLAPGTTYYYRVFAANAGGSAQGAAHTFTTAPAPPVNPPPPSLPPPVLARTGNIAPASGHVLVQLPGTHRFTTLTAAEQVPFGTLINATHGTVTVTTAAPHGGTQTGQFFDGEFVLTQGRNGLVVATLAGGNFAVCPTARERAHRARASSKRASGSHVVRKLWTDAHGSFSTKGNYAAGAVQGTEWLTEDLCDGTLIRVTRDRVAVTNLVNHHHLTVKAGHHYLAKAP